MSERHVHEWVRDEDHDGIRAWACTQCDETSATCGTCGRPSGSSLLLCETCRRHADVTLDRIARAVELRQPPHPDGVRFRRVSTPTGDAGQGGATGADEDGEAPRRDSVDAQMWGWVARWTEYVGASSAHWADMLKSLHIWAAHNPALSDWPRYWTDLRRLMWRARAEAGLMPQVQAEPCVHCGGDCVRDWSDRDWEPVMTGLSDVVRCLGCGMTWGDRADWRRVTRHHIVTLPDEHPDALVTMDQARMIWPDVPAGTWRQWVKRDRDAWAESIDEAQEWHYAWCALEAEPGPPIARDEPPDLAERRIPEWGERDGVSLYRVGDLQVLAQRWSEETRRGVA